jgi:2-polyprenyl-3-methyl-5-hydroxy-6-metoxy-1,4-benzoquinol methylase
MQLKRQANIIIRESVAAACISSTKFWHSGFISRIVFIKHDIVWGHPFEFVMILQKFNPKMMSCYFSFPKFFIRPMKRNRFLYRLMYRIKRPPWDTGITPPELIEAFTTGAIPPGPVLDLGCGTGTNAIYMAQQGRAVTGIDFAPEAITKARRKARETGVEHAVQFLLADVTRLAELSLPLFSFALDMGCYHGLSVEDQRRYSQGLAKQVIPGGRVMMFTLDPRRRFWTSFGVSPEQVQALFSPWFDTQRIQRDEFFKGGATWFWLKRREGEVD